jgi:L-asparaginase
MERKSQKPTVALVTTGGTIGMVRDAESGESVPGLKGADLLARLTLVSNFTIRVINLTYDSGSVDSLLALARRLAEEARDQIAGIVVTHGTDTLEEVAYAIDEMMSSPVPIVFTGAMRPTWAADYDGIRNLENAFRLATAVSRKCGVLVTMNDAIFEAWSVYKSDTSAKDAFAARRGAPYGQISGDQVSLTWKPIPRAHLDRIPASLPSSIPILTMGIADDGCLLDELPVTSVQGLVVAGMATGSVPPGARSRVRRLAERGLPIVLCSSATSGRTAEEYYYPHAYDDLRNAGVAIENWLSPRKARIRLMLSLALNDPYTPFGEEFVKVRIPHS